MPRVTLQGSHSGRIFHRLNRNLIIIHMVITALAQPLAAYFSGRSIRMAVAACAVSLLLICVVCYARQLGLVRLRKPLMTVALVFASVQLYNTNGGVFGTSLEPALLSFGTASLIALDGKILSLIIGLSCGWSFPMVGKVFDPEFYFGNGFTADWVRAIAHATWWSLAVVSGYVLGLGVHQIIAALESSRAALEAAQAKEREMQANNDEIRAALAEERAATLAAIGASFDASMQTAVRAVIATSEAVRAEAVSTREIAASAERVSEAVVHLATEASVNTEIVATAAALLSGSIGQARRQIAEVAAATVDAVNRVHESDAALLALVQSGQRVEAVVGLIDNIAGQTNLLALNATIEAARAGVAGAGFAVVAAEVKRLATQTSQATSEVARLVAGMRAALEGTVSANQSVEASVNMANTYAASVSAVMAEQDAATASIAETVHAVARGTKATSQRTEEAARFAGHTVRTVHEMLDRAAALNQDAAELQQTAALFVAQLRAV